jgi:hypothetical protein
MKVIIRQNSFDENSDRIFDTDNALDLIIRELKVWNPNNKIYKNCIEAENEISCRQLEDLEVLLSLDCDLFVVCYPQGLGLIGAALVGATVAINVAKKDKKSRSSSTATVAEESESESAEQSPNNSLSERSNSNRLNARIPDIYGTVISTPDLIMESLRLGDEEYQYLCVGVGEYEISEIKDGLGNFVGDLEVYGPGTSPNSGDEPQMRIGNPIARKISNINAIDEFETEFVIFDKEELLVEVVSGAEVEQEVNPPLFSHARPFFNYGGVNVSYQEVDENEDPIGPLYTAGAITALPVKFPSRSNWKINILILQGSGYRFEQNPDWNGSIIGSEDNDKRYKITKEFSRSVSVNNVFSNSEIELPDFGNVTTIYTRVLATPNGSENNRKLTCKASRKIPILNSNLTFDAAATTSEIKDIIPAIVTSPSIGNRPLSDLNLQNLIDLQNEIVSYFGSKKACYFNYTFDDANLTFEDTISVICETAFCSAYRRGLKIEFFFEKKIDSSSILFNHRNKLPGSESRTVSFGNVDDHDGVEVVYNDINLRKPISIHIPSDASAVNPERLVEIGVNNRLQAHFHAHRNWNRIQYQNTLVEFEATQEASLLRRKERILVADNTRPGTIDGEIVSISGNVLTLSQEVELEENEDYTIFIQNDDGTIVPKSVTAGTTAKQVIIGSTSGLSLSTDPENYALATFEITKDTTDRKNAFLVQEREPQSQFSSVVRAINYDDRYYANDKDLLNTLIDENGIILPKPAVLFDTTSSYWTFDETLGDVSDVTFEMQIKTVDDTFMLLCDAYTSTKYAYPMQDSTSTILFGDAGTPSFYIDGILRTGLNRSQLHAILADDQWHTVRIEHLDLSSWTLISNISSVFSYRYIGYMKNWKAKFGDSDEWEHSSESGDSNGFETFNTSIELI